MVLVMIASIQLPDESDQMSGMVHTNVHLRSTCKGQTPARTNLNVNKSKTDTNCCQYMLTCNGIGGIRFLGNSSDLACDGFQYEADDETSTSPIVVVLSAFSRHGLPLKLVDGYADTYSFTLRTISGWVDQHNSIGPPLHKIWQGY